MADRLVRPPAHIAPIVEILGQDDAFDFLSEFGGAPLYLAENPGARSPLAGRFGRERAVKLCRAMGGPGNIYIPVARDWMMKVLKARGDGRFEIARKLGVSHVQVRRVIGRQDHLQIDLFEPSED